MIDLECYPPAISRETGEMIPRRIHVPMQDVVASGKDQVTLTEATVAKEFVGTYRFKSAQGNIYTHAKSGKAIGYLGEPVLKVQLASL